jgi:hypothetical protein
LRFEILIPLPYHPCSFKASAELLLTMAPGKITYFGRPSQATAKADK